MCTCGGGRGREKKGGKVGLDLCQVAAIMHMQIKPDDANYNPRGQLHKFQGNTNRAFYGVVKQY